MDDFFFSYEIFKDSFNSLAIALVLGIRAIRSVEDSQHPRHPSLAASDHLLSYRRVSTSTFSVASRLHGDYPINDADGSVVYQVRPCGLPRYILRPISGQSSTDTGCQLFGNEGP